MDRRKRKCTLCIMHCAFLLLLSCSIPLQETVIAKNHEDAGEYQKAIDVYNQLLQKNTLKKAQSTQLDPAGSANVNYLYYLLIGDNYLKLDNPTLAEEYYVKAIDGGASTEFIIDRIRLLSRYYAEHGDYEQAIEILRRYHNVSPEEIDYSIDKLHKGQVNQLKGTL